MKAAVVDGYGPPEVLRIKNVPKPKIKDGEILVKVKIVAVTAGDSRIRDGRFPKGFAVPARLALGITKQRKKILGSTYSGVVEEVGKNVTDYKVGDEVCGMTGSNFGTYAEFIKIKKFKSITKKPRKISHKDAAGMLFGGTAALFFLRDKVEVKKGEKVCINGASGAVGTNAVQLAKHFGAEVTGVTSGGNAKLVKSLGAKHIIDHQKQNLTESGQKFDIVLDTVGNLTPKTGKKLLTKNGRLALMVGGIKEMLARNPVKTGIATEKKEDMEFLLSLMERGKLKVVIDKTYAFDDIVAAHKHADTGRKVGNVLLKLA